jgi:hypothetical protein
MSPQSDAAPIPFKTDADADELARCQTSQPRRRLRKTETLSLAIRNTNLTAISTNDIVQKRTAKNQLLRCCGQARKSLVICNRLTRLGRRDVIGQAEHREDTQ